MLADLLDDVKIESLIRQESLPQLCSVADRLRRLAQETPEALGPVGLELLDELLATAAEAEQSMALQRARIRHLESLSITDELTGLLNRRGFEQELSRALARARRSGETGLLVTCDLNPFKAINDTHGPPAGDALLRTVGQVLKRNTRESDYVARIGGDEFSVIMTNTSLARSEELAAKLAALVNGLTVAWQEQVLPVSAAFGMMAYDKSSQPENLLFMADQSLYRNKSPRLV